MIGIVLVSHSAKLAEGVRELAKQMVQGRVPLAVAAGIDDPDNPIGTDAMKVHAAIESVFSEDGVLVLMDLGSAILSAETALEFLSPEQRAHVHLCEAPLVEGALAAAVQASVGSDMEQVLEEARGALTVKANQLQLAPGGAEKVAEMPSATTKRAPQTLSLTVQNRLGLHARPAARFVSIANQFQADIRVKKGEQSASAKSINQVATLGVRQGDAITVTAVGPDADEALQAIESLADNNFGDAEEITAPVVRSVTPASGPTATAPAAEGKVQGIAASPGFAIGPVVRYRPTLPKVLERSITEPAAEWKKLEAAVSTAKKEIEALKQQATNQVGAAEAAIFEAHLLFLQDPALLDAAKERIFEERINAEAAWQQAIEAMANRYRALADEYMQARAADLLDVGQRVLRQLMHVEPPSLDFPQPSILVAADLTPSHTARLDPGSVLGICTELGGSTSHSAILARALGIPAIVGLGQAVTALVEGRIVAIDGTQGQVWLDPDAEQKAALEGQRQAWLDRQREAKAASQQAAETQDGRHIEVAANIGGLYDATVAVEYGAEAVGLFRTEFLFLEQPEAPTEEDQLAVYRQVVQAVQGRPLIIRTLDVGGDKPLPYLDVGHEENPFLGWRGIRFCLGHPDLFKTQLRAILRASAGENGNRHNVKIMFPMISTVAELRAAKSHLNEVKAELHEANVAFDANVEVGIMIEVPSAVATASQLAAEADFFSIGTNDLTQYVMAADRGNANVADLASAYQPAVLRMVQQTVAAAHAAGIWVGLCGELAGDPLITPVLVGLGLDELSMNAPTMPAVKQKIRQLTMDRAREIAAKALSLDTATAVREWLMTASS